jgi:hypothetical protein
MDIAAILDLVLKGLGVVSTLVSVGMSAEPAIKVIADLVTGAKSGTVTDQQLTDAEATLDGLIADFNTPIA